MSENKYQFATEVIDLPSKGILYAEDNPLSSGQIEIKHPTAREEDILTSANLIKKGLVIDKFIESVIVTKCDKDSLIVGDKNAIMIASRILAFGPEYEVRVNCPLCGEQGSHVINLAHDIESVELDESLYTKGQNKFSTTLPSGASVEYMISTHGVEKAIQQEINNLSKVKGRETPQLTTRLAHLILSVNGDSDKGVVRNFVRNMSIIDSRALRKEMQSMGPNIDSTFSYHCQECGGTSSLDLVRYMDTNFFWPEL